MTISRIRFDLESTPKMIALKVFESKNFHFRRGICYHFTVLRNVNSSAATKTYYIKLTIDTRSNLYSESKLTLQIEKMISRSRLKGSREFILYIKADSTKFIQYFISKVSLIF